MEIKVGTLINGIYRVTGEVGHGGMAEIYEAFDVIHKKNVALKFIREDTMKNPKNIARFNNEATIVSNLNHPNIVKTIDHGEIDGRAYIVSEYVKGKTLRDILDERCPLPIAECVEIMLQVSEALKYAHEKGVVHCDIKPHNILYERDGTVKITDFGIAMAEALNKDMVINSDEIEGSVHYLAPEITQGKMPSNQSDIYSAGVTLFEMVTGHVPFDSTSPTKTALMHVNEEFPSPRLFVTSCPLDIEYIILKACAKKLKDRYKTAEQFHNDLLSFKEGREIEKKKGFLNRVFGFK